MLLRRARPEVWLALSSLAILGVACGSSPAPGNTSSGGGGDHPTSSSSSSGSGGSATSSSSSSSASSSSSSSAGGGTGGAGSSSSSSSAGGGTGGSGGMGSSSSSTGGGTGGMGSSSTSSSGGPVCTGTQVDCGGACADLASDGAHCGACGHSCLGAACGGGICAATDVVAAHTALLVKVDSSTIFYTTYYDIYRLPKAGGTPTLLNTATSGNSYRAFDIAIDTGNLYWTSGASTTTGYVLQVSKSGPPQAEIYNQLGGYGKPWTLVTGDLDSSGYAGAIYWAQRGDGMWFPSNIVKTTLGPSGHSSAIIAKVPVKFLFGMARDATYAYVTAQDNGSIYRAPLAGGTSEQIVTGLSSPSYLVTDGQNLYVLELGAFANGGYPNGRLLSVPVAGGTPTVLASPIPNPGNLTVDGGKVYFTSSWSASTTTADGEVAAVPTSGGAVVKVATGQPNPSGVAVDTTYVYWANYGVGNNDGGIRRAPR